MGSQGAFDGHYALSIYISCAARAFFEAIWSAAEKAAQQACDGALDRKRRRRSPLPAHSKSVCSRAHNEVPDWRPN